MASAFRVSPGCTFSRRCSRSARLPCTPSTRTKASGCGRRASSVSVACSRCARHCAYSVGGRAKRSSDAATPSAYRVPSATSSLARSKSAEVSVPSGGESSKSCAVSNSTLRRTFCSVRMLIICSVTPTTLPSASRPASGVPMFTAITTSTPRLRATSTGRLFTSPPSPRMRPFHSSGANTPGTDMLARSAAARSPESSTTGWPLSMSVATARKGMGSALKWSRWRVCNV